MSQAKWRLYTVAILGSLLLLWMYFDASSNHNMTFEMAASYVNGKIILIILVLVLVLFGIFQPQNDKKELFQNNSRLNKRINPLRLLLVSAPIFLLSYGASVYMPINNYIMTMLVVILLGGSGLIGLVSIVELLGRVFMKRE
ncbi:MAG: hypothetical protein Q7K26_05680 [bacterium]|nr:hypothetical protein [bacterium]